MADYCPTTPAGAFKTPIMQTALPEATVASLAAFDAGLALMEALQRADACLDRSGQTAALAGFELLVADLQARADATLEGFFFSHCRDLHHLSTAAWVMLLLLQSDGADLYGLAQRSAKLRHAATNCACSPLLVERVSAPRLLAAAVVLDLMIDAAMDDYAAIDPENVGDLRGIVGQGLAALMAQTQSQADADVGTPDVSLAVTMAHDMDPTGGPDLNAGPF